MVTAVYRATKRMRASEINRAEVMARMGAEKLLQLYRNMARNRAFDDKLEELLQRGVSITQHSTTGQEATPNAACLTLNPQDYVMPYHRGWGWAIGRGMDPGRMLAELMFKKTGYCGGKGGPHLADYSLGILGRPGVQGAHIGIAAGVALSAKMRASGQVCLCFFGNGSSNSSSFHESLNLAKVWNVPCVYICENNLYAIFSTMAETTAVADIADRALGYDIPGYVTDGNDAVGVYHVVAEAVARARAGEGPSLIETKTYRWLGHSSLDRLYYGGYRSKEEVDAWKERCPIKRLATDLLGAGIANATDLERVHEEARAEMDRAEKFAEESPFPEPDEYFRDNYASPVAAEV